MKENTASTSSAADRDARLEILKLEYVALRAEIIQSISYQHQILLAGYGATGVFFSYVVGKAADAYLPPLIIVPFILLGMAALWTVECNRMVRASYYIGCSLWPALRSEVNCEGEHWTKVEWECWIRLYGKGKPSEFRDRQDRSQRIVIFWGPVFLSVLATIPAFWSAMLPSPGKGAQIQGMQDLLPWVIISCAVIAAYLWVPLYKDIRAISNLGASRIDEAKPSPRAVP